MNHPETTRELYTLCPICGTTYHTPENRPAPTCGSPSCIREARAQGKPFAVPTRLPEEKPEAKKKRTGKKSEKK